MKIYIIKLKESQITEFFVFCVTYHIRNVANWTKETGGFFSDTSFYFVVSDLGSGGITQEEKARLITETYSNNFQNL